MKTIKQLLILTVLFVLTDNIYAQTGIRFEQGLNWQQVLAKAKAEHKYIFVDCYATWCDPCKQMDKNIYSQKAVGDAMNDKFICIGLQVDVSKNDDEHTKSWYKDAEQIAKDYAIQFLPT